jgi:hypothetical protein
MAVSWSMARVRDLVGVQPGVVVGAWVAVGGLVVDHVPDRDEHGRQLWPEGSGSHPRPQRLGLAAPGMGLDLRLRARQYDFVIFKQGEADARDAIATSDDFPSGPDAR